MGVVFTMSFNLPLFFTNARLNNVLILLLAANTIILFVLRIKENKPVVHWLIVLFISVYAAYVLGLIHTENLRHGIRDLTEKKINLLIFPILFYLAPKLDFNQAKNILLAFVMGCLCTVLFCLSAATYYYVTLGTTSFFFYHELSTLAGAHAVYLSMFSCFSIVILLYVYPEKFARSARTKFLFYLATFLFILSIFLLSGRTHITILIVGVIVYLTFLFNQRSNLFRSVLKAGVVGLAITGIAFLFPNNRLRFKQAINYKNEFGIDRQWGEQQMRPLMWTCTFELIKSEPVVGVGTGDNLDELHECYVDHQFTTLTYLEGEGIRFNAHNQFLEITLALGVPGLLVFLISLFAPLQFSVRRKQVLYAVFLLLFITSCLTESLLERQTGCVFFGFFNTFLFLYDRRENWPDRPFDPLKIK
jgi:O-antigen ligase